MERLTVFDGQFWEHKGFPTVGEDTVDEFIDCVKELAERLAAIEDILGDTYDLGRLRELVQADREGRCMVLPCGGFDDKDGENALKSAMNTVFYHNNPVTRYIADAVAEKLTREAADVAPVVHGRWVWKQGPCEDECNLVCSNCGLESVGHYDEEDDSYQYERTSFCHHCGAKMDGGEKDAQVPT